MRSVLEHRSSLKVKIYQWSNKLLKALLTLNLFSRRNSEVSDVHRQIITTRLYIGCLFVFTLILVSVTTLEQRMTTIIVPMPTVTQFENLFQSGKLPHSCPCSQIGIQRSKFISLTPTLHQVCSSRLASEAWLYILFILGNPIHRYHHSDIRSYGSNIFRTLQYLCSLANETVTDALHTFLNTSSISTHVLPREQLHEQAQALIINFQSHVENTFKQIFSLLRETNQGNQFISSRVSNFLFDGVFDNNGDLIHVQTYAGTTLLSTNTLTSCSCALNTCTQPLGFVDMSDDRQTIVSMVEIPGMYSACYPLDGHRMSTLECWFNETCASIVLSFLASAGQYHMEPLNSSMLVRFSPTTTIGDIIDSMMVEMWTNMINYEMYYNICKPLTCTYTSYHRFDWVYTITVLTSVFGGLSVFLRIVCPLLVKLYMHCRRRRAVPTPSKYLTNSFSQWIPSFMKVNQQLCASMVCPEFLFECEFS